MHTDFVERMLEKIKEEFLPVVTVIHRLRNDGYTMNFTLHHNKWLCVQTKTSYSSQEIRVDEIHRVHDEKGLLQGIFIYAVSDVWNGISGILIIDVNEVHYSSLYS